MKLESFIERLARASVRGVLSAFEEDEPAQAAPLVVPVDAVRQAVAEFLQPLIDQERTVPEDLFAQPEPPEDFVAEQLLRQRERAAERVREREAERPGTYDPNAPDRSPWTAPGYPETA